MSRRLHRKTGYVSLIWINIISNRRAQRLLISFAKRSLGSVNLVKSTNNWGFKKYDIVVWNGSKWFRIGLNCSSLKRVSKFRLPSKRGNYWLAEWMSVFRKNYNPKVSNFKTSMKFPTQSHWNMSRVKVKFSPRWIQLCLMKAYGEIELSLDAYWTTAQDDGECLAAWPGRFNPGEGF